MNFLRRLFRKRKIQFTDKVHPMMGIVAFLIGIASLVFMFALFIGSAKARGHAGIGYGYAGMLNMIIAIVGFVVGVRCYGMEDVYYLYPNLGVGLNGIIAAGYIILYFVGIL